MDLQEILLVLLSGLGVFHGIFIALILWNSKTGSAIPNRLLSVLMFILSFRIGKSVLLEFTKLDILYIYLGLCLLMFLGPLFYLYCNKLLKKENTITKKDLLHFLPGIAFIIMAIPYEAIGFRNLPEVFVMGLFISFYGHFLFYLLYTKIKLLNDKRLSGISKEVKEWLSILFYGLISIWIVYVLNIFEREIPYIIGPIFYSIVVYAITYIAISKKYLQTINTVKYQTTNFSTGEIDELFNELQTLIEKDKLYLDPDISLSILSKQVKASAQKISFAINSKAQVNFNEYINRFRINYAVDLIKADGSERMTIASIATDSGFNSLSSFNNSFKKIMGKTPTAFRTSLEKN